MSNSDRLMVRKIYKIYVLYSTSCTSFHESEKSSENDY